MIDKDALEAAGAAVYDIWSDGDYDDARTFASLAVETYLYHPNTIEVSERWKAMFQEAAASVDLIGAMVGEMFGPIASLESEEATLSRGPEPKHRAEAILEALQRVQAALAAQPEAVPVAVKPPQDETEKYRASRGPLWSAVFDILHDYRMSNMADQDGCGYPLVDLMSNDGQSIATGEWEMICLTDEIMAAIPALTTPKPEAPRMVLADDGWQAEAEAQAAALCERAGLDALDDFNDFMADLEATLIEFAGWTYTLPTARAMLNARLATGGGE